MVFKKRAEFRLDIACQVGNLEHHSNKEVAEDFWEILSDSDLDGNVHHPCINQIMVYDG